MVGCFKAEEKEKVEEGQSAKGDTCTAVEEYENVPELVHVSHDEDSAESAREWVHWAFNRRLSTYLLNQLSYPEYCSMMKMGQAFIRQPRTGANSKYDQPLDRIFPPELIRATLANSKK